MLDTNSAVFLFEQSKTNKALTQANKWPSEESEN